MTREELNDEYFEWMYQLVFNEKDYRRLSYRKLLHCLHDRDFIYILPMDSNRAEDGIDLRYRFAYEMGYDYPMVSSYLDDRPCSVLEMMIALAVRCEDHIMGDPDIGNRTGEWFHDMLVNLGLDSMDDTRFDEDEASYILTRFLNREYSWNGEGGLFRLKNCRRDMRTVEIWYQMCWYLDEIEQS